MESKVEAEAKSAGKQTEQSTKPTEPPRQDYIHVRARRGQATGSHSLAERGFLDGQFTKLQQLQDESNPDFVVEVVSLFFEDSEKLLSDLTRAIRKRKWDQPAESLISAHIAVLGVLPLGNVGSLAGMTPQGVAPLSGTSAINNTPYSTAGLQQVLAAPSLQQHVAALVQKIR